MNILLIEDTLTKIDEVCKFLKNTELNIESIVYKNSWQSGLRELIENGDYYNFLILDMSMPRYDSEIADANEEFVTYAGWEILKEMKLMHLKIPTCIFTSYDYFGEGSDAINRSTLDKSLSEEFDGIYKGMIYFRKTESNWKDKLYKVLAEVKL